MSPSPIASYMAGAAAITIGLNAIANPRDECECFGLPLEQRKLLTTVSDGSTTPVRGIAFSPPMYLKGTRELTYGLGLITLQYQRNEDAVTTFLLLLSLAGLGDGIVVSRQGRELRGRPGDILCAFDVTEGKMTGAQG
ncbi:hypothetical protein JX266_011941 [Neoarthrinium moseri]|nr:hypothetical protein JX266_011941 [Neoarthrinium moseri]